MNNKFITYTLLMPTELIICPVIELRSSIESMTRVYEETCEAFGEDSTLAQGMYDTLSREEERLEVMVRAMNEWAPSIHFRVGGI